MVKARRTPLAVISPAAIILLLTACSNEHVYEYSVDVNSSGWTPTDTLLFPIHVGSEARSFSPIEQDYPYCLSLDFRYEYAYPAPVMLLHVEYDRRYDFEVSLGDDGGFPDGEGWGSMMTKEFDVTKACLSFPDSGDYLLKVWPDSIVSGVYSVTATLE